MRLKPKAFTLIELLVVIAIIGILATISVLALSNARAKSRDAKRAGDMKQVSTALELFFNDKNRYPTIEEWNTGKIYSTSTGATSTYMQVIPNAPTPADGSCGDENAFSYVPSSDLGSYSISFCLGNTTGTLAPGPKCLTPGGIIDANCDDSENLLFVGFNTCGDIGSYVGKYYPTVYIDENGGHNLGLPGQCWMAKNLDVGTMIGSKLADNSTLQNQANDSLIEKYCSGYIAQGDAGGMATGVTNCGIYGGLYQWSEALSLPASCNTVDCTADPTNSCCNSSAPIQGICPIGWHIPSDAEWLTLVRSSINNPTCDISFGCSPAGTELQVDGTSGFDALPAGLRYSAGNFLFFGSRLLFWSTMVDGLNSGVWYSDAGNAFIHTSDDVRTQGLSVRCIKN